MLSEAALAAEIIRAIEPLTEASPAAMLGTLLAQFGALARRGACVMVGSKAHYPNLFVAAVRQTARDQPQGHVGCRDPARAGGGGRGWVAVHE